ncbi:MAG: sugar isomerase, partial [Nakamurella sp.]
MTNTQVAPPAERARFVLAELASQPEMWTRAVRVAADRAAVLPQPGERIAVVGCGTSWFVAQAYASYR